MSHLPLHNKSYLYSLLWMHRSAYTGCWFSGSWSLSHKGICFLTWKWVGFYHLQFCRKKQKTTTNIYNLPLSKPVKYYFVQNIFNASKYYYGKILISSSYDKELCCDLYKPLISWMLMILSLRYIITSG